MSEIRGHRPDDRMMAIPPGYETKIRLPGPSLAERIARFALHIVWTAVGLLTIYLMVGVISAFAAIGDRLEQIQTPAPAVTECVGEEFC